MQKPATSKRGLEDRPAISTRCARDATQIRRATELSPIHRAFEPRS